MSPFYINHHHSSCLAKRQGRQARCCTPSWAGQDLAGLAEASQEYLILYPSSHFLGV